MTIGGGIGLGVVRDHVGKGDDSEKREKKRKIYGHGVLCARIHYWCLLKTILILLLQYGFVGDVLDILLYN